MPPRVQFLGRKLRREALTTQSCIARFISVTDVHCVLCHDDFETIDHIFLHCPFIVACLPTGLNLNLTHFGKVHDLCKHLTSRPNGYVLHLFFSLLYHIWLLQHDIIFNQCKFNHVSCSRRLIQQHNLQHSNLRSQHISIGWTRPNHGSVKLNVDVGFQHLNCTYAIIIKGHLGTSSEAVVDHASVATPLESECIAIREELYLLHRRVYTSVTMEPHFLTAVHLLHGHPSTWPWRPRHICLLALGYGIKTYCIY